MEEYGTSLEEKFYSAHEGSTAAAASEVFTSSHDGEESGHDTSALGILVLEEMFEGLQRKEHSFIQMKNMSRNGWSH